MNNTNPAAINFVTAFTALQVAAHANSRNKGFWTLIEQLQAHPDFRDRAKELDAIWRISRVGLMHSEASEVIEGIRHDQHDGHLPHRSMEVCELADIIIRIMDYAGAYRLPVAEVILEKMAYNANRPHMHGKQA